MPGTQAGTEQTKLAQQERKISFSSQDITALGLQTLQLLFDLTGNNERNLQKKALF